VADEAAGAELEIADLAIGFDRGEAGAHGAGTLARMRLITASALIPSASAR
jgi:hypothetical protein